MSNMSNILPPGYKSVQDFLLHAHDNKQVAKSSPRATSILNDHVQYQKEVCLIKKPEKTPKTTPPQQSRYYYERSAASSVPISDLPPPTSIIFSSSS